MPESDLASTNHYSHQPLDPTKPQIRLLKVIRCDSVPIECTLEIFDLDATPKYTALSYRWGSSITDHTIFINGRSLQISANLFYFLETYRCEEIDEYLYIDQICIAQAVTEERNHQVGLMSQIYSQCQYTIVWLCDHKDRYPILAEEFNRTHTRKALLGLLRDSYFTRLWIVQEVLLAPNIWIFTSGNVWIPWHAIRDCFLSKAWGPEHSILKALIVPNSFFKRKSLTLGSCILTFSGQNCENPKDRVYGLLGIVQDNDRFVIDYDKTIEQVYMDAVIAVGPHGRDRCAERLGDLFRIPFRKRQHLIDLLDLIQPVHFRGQVTLLRDCSPTTAYGSGLVGSIGLVFAEQPMERPRSNSGSDNNDKLFSPTKLAPVVSLNPQELPWTVVFNGADDGVSMHEAPMTSDGADGGPPFDAIQSIMDFHRILHAADWNDKIFPQFLCQDWQTQERIASEVFWTYVASREGQPRPEHIPRPLKCREKWCYGYRGNVYEYARVPRWRSLFDYRPDTELMQYILEACSRVRSITYPRPVETTEETAIHWVRRPYQRVYLEPKEGRSTSLESLSTLECWASCNPEHECRFYGWSSDILEDYHAAAFEEIPGLRQTPW